MHQEKKRAVLGLRYGPKDIKEYDRVIQLAKENDLSKSAAGKLLVNRGLTHTDNPEPLVKKVEKPMYRDRYPQCRSCDGKSKEKIIYKDRIVEKPIEKVVEKVVYRDKPNGHIKDSGEHLKVDNQNSSFTLSDDPPVKNTPGEQELPENAEGVN